MATPAEKILVRGVNWLGDAVMSTPALMRLREAKPAARIVLLTPEKLLGLWSGHPAVDQVMTFASGQGVFSVARRVRREALSTALVFPNSPRSALEMFLARIPVRVGYARPWRNAFLTQVVHPRTDEVGMHKRSRAEVRGLVSGTIHPQPSPIGPQSHHMFQYLHLVKSVGACGDAIAPLIAVTVEEVQRIRSRFEDGQAAGRILIGINAGAEYGPAKRWPADRFVAAAVTLSRQVDCSFWILGGASDLGIANEVMAGICGQGVARGRVRLLAGQTSLRELCAVLRACNVVLTNDTGPMHVAAAVGTSVVVPFGSTSWRLTAPGLPGDPRHRLLDANVACSPCFRRECPIDFRCMTGISAEMAVQGVQAALKA
jgi:heptosyltransferase-2